MNKYIKDPIDKTKTAYEILECKPDDDIQTIRKKYMELKMKYPEKAADLHEAFRILKTPEERLKLDFFYYYKWREK